MSRALSPGEPPSPGGSRRSRIAAALAPYLSAPGARRRWLSAAVLLVLALATFWLARRLAPSPTPPPEATREDPDYYLESFSTTTMDEQGKPKRRLSAARLLHFPLTDTNELSQPHLVLYHPTRPPWNIEAERGWVSASGEVVLLLGKVHAWREDRQGRRAIDIRTRDLRILPESDYAETDKPVVIRSLTTESHGVGMRAYMQESRVELLSRVTTRYQRTAESG